MRSKEVANDYRFFPEPELLPIIIDAEYIEAVRATLPELPGAKRARFTADYGLSDYDAALLVPNHALADYFESVLTAGGAAKPAANWILGDLTAALNRNEIDITDSPISAAQLAGQFPGGQIDAGVQVFTAFLGADHRAVGKDRHFSGLLRHTGIAGHGEMDVCLTNSITEVRCGPLQLGLGVIPQRRRDLEVATMDQQLHASLLCRLLSAS